MKTTTPIIIHKLSILMALLFLSTVLNAQTGIKIKERVEILTVSKQSTPQCGEFSTSATFVMPYAGHAHYEVIAFDSVRNNDSRLVMNGTTIFRDVVQESQDPPIEGSLGQFAQGQTLTFQMLHSDGSPWLAWNSEVVEYQCGSWCNIVFSLIPIDICAGETWPTNICMTVSCDNLELLDKISLFTGPSPQNYVFGDSTYMVAWYDFICWSYTMSLPEDATFTFTMTEGQEYAILQDAYGNEGTSLNANYSASQCWVKIKTIGDEPSQPVYVTVEAKTTVTPNTVSGRFEFRPGDLKIIPTKSVIVYGDTARFDVWKKLPDGSLGALAAGSAFGYNIVEGNDAGDLLSPDLSYAWDNMGGWDMTSVFFQAVEESPQGDTTLVKLRVEAQEPDTTPPPPPCPDCIPCSVKPGDPGSGKPIPNKRFVVDKATKGVYEMKSPVKHVNQTHVEENVKGSNLSKNSHKTSTQLAQMDTNTSQPKSLRKNTNGSYSYGHEDDQLKSKYINKATNQTVELNQSVSKSNHTTWEKNASGGYSAKVQNKKVSKTESNADVMPILVGFSKVNVIKSCIQAKLKKTPLSIGDTTDLEFTYTETGQPVRVDELIDVSTLDSTGLHGFLMTSSGEINTTMNGISQPIKYIAPSTIQGDSLIIYISATASESGSSGGTASGSVNASTKNRSSEKIATKVAVINNVNAATIKGPNGIIIHPQSLSHSTIRALQENPCNRDAGTVKYNILLGETRYYYTVKDEKENLIIQETKDPTKLPPGGWLPDVSFDDPVAADGSETNPVYWEDQRPTYDPNDGTFTGSETLPQGIIRLVGRFFDYDGGKVYKTKLTANKPNEGKTTSIIIEVEKPASLGNSYNTSTDVSKKVLDIDELCIKAGAEIGIPPQIIKGQMFNEADNTGGQFNPCFRYEPWEDAKFQKRYIDELNDFLEQPFVVTQASMGTGKIIPIHYGYGGAQIPYPTTQKKIGQFVVDNWPNYFDDEKDIFKGLDINSPMNDWWELEKNLYFGQYHDLEKACNAATQKIKDEIVENRPEWAQTRKSTSYSIIQICYETAKTFGYNDGKSVDDLDSWNRPEDLNDHVIAMPFYKNVTLDHLADIIGESLTVSNWADGYEVTWIKVIQEYNSGEPSYGTKAVNNSKLFEPQEN